MIPSYWSQPVQTIRYRKNGKAPPAFERRARGQGTYCIPGRSCSFLITRYRVQVPITQGNETNCKKSDEAIVVMKHMKVCGAKGRNTTALSDGKCDKTLEVMKM